MTVTDNIINSIGSTNFNNSEGNCMKFKLARYLLSSIGTEYGEARLELRDILRKNRAKGNKRAALYAPIKKWVINRAKHHHKTKPSASKAWIAQKIWEELHDEFDNGVFVGVAPPDINTINRYWLPKGNADTWQ